MSYRRCSVEGCQSPHLAKDYCSKHYNRSRTGRGLDDAEYQLKKPPRPCRYDNCCRNAGTGMRGYCNVHRQRLREGRDMGAPIRPKWGNRIPWGDSDKARQMGFGSAHSRVKRLWGSAKLYLCIACGNQAHEWAYDGADPTQLLASPSPGRLVAYFSAYPEFYMPMCRKCHTTRDGAFATAELSEYRIWAHRTGLRLTDITKVTNG